MTSKKSGGATKPATKGVSPYLRKTPKEVDAAVARAKADFKKSGYKTVEDYFKSQIKT